MEAKQYEKAISKLTKGVELNPTYKECIYQRGKAYNGLSQNMEACKDFKTSYELGMRIAGEYLGRYCK